jgi:hypothetical protein
MSESSSMQDLEKIEKELIAEQPGLAVSITGILLSLFLGFIIRSTLSPERIIGLVEKAAQKIDHRFKAHVGAASVSLADGSFPEIAVVVKNLSLESDEVCWMRPSIEIDEVKLPLNIFRFFRGDIYIHEVLANEVSVSIRSDLSKCNSTNQVGQAQTLDVRNIAQVQLETTTKKVKNAWEGFSRSRDSIDTVHFNRVRIHYLPIAFTSFEIRDLNISIDSKEPKKISALGRLALAGETLSGDYSSTANLKVNFDETSPPEWGVSIDGSWREGHYLIKSNFGAKQKNASLMVNMNQIPLNQLFPLMKKYHLMQANYNAQQVWLTLKGGISGPISDLKKQPFKIDQIKLEGNIGELESDDIQITSLEPLRFKPVDIDIRSLKIEGLLDFLNYSHPHPALGELGTFRGKASFTDPQNIRINGEHSGLEFVFSSQLDRQVQKISLIQADVLIHPDKWLIKIDRLKPEDGVFIGNVKIETDSNWKRQEINAKIDELTLSPPVQKVLTDGGEMASFNGNINLTIEKGILNQISGETDVSGLKIENMLMKHAKMNITTVQGDVGIDWLAQGLVISQDSGIFKMFQPVLQTNASPNGLDIPFVSAQIKTRMLKDFNWKNFNFKYDKHKFNSSGGWNAKGELSGSAVVIGIPKNRKYNITGNRERPLFTEVK